MKTHVKKGDEVEIIAGRNHKGKGVRFAGEVIRRKEGKSVGN